jgi:hypothetical protein
MHREAIDRGGQPWSRRLGAFWSRADRSVMTALTLKALSRSGSCVCASILSSLSSSSSSSSSLLPLELVSSWADPVSALTGLWNERSDFTYQKRQTANYPARNFTARNTGSNLTRSLSFNANSCTRGSNLNSTSTTVIKCNWRLVAM